MKPSNLFYKIGWVLLALALLLRLLALDFAYGVGVAGAVVWLIGYVRARAGLDDGGDDGDD